MRLKFSKYQISQISFFSLAGEKAVFSCATEIKQQGCTATWMKDNAPIGDAMADRAKITAKDNVFTLEITKVAAGDKGNYTCRVTNDNGEAVACSAQLEVHACKYKIEKLRMKSA